MAYNIFYSPASLDDLDEICDYIKNILLNPTGADKTVSRILSSAKRLKTFPDSGAPLYILDVKTNYRFLISGNFLIFYRFVTDTIYIDRIIYKKRDYIKILFDN